MYQWLRLQARNSADFGLRRPRVRTAARGLPEVTKRANTAAHMCRMHVARAVPAMEHGGDRKSEDFKVPAGHVDFDTSPGTLRQWRSTYRQYLDEPDEAAALLAIEARCNEVEERVTRAAMAGPERVTTA